jgi:hypothetical protein
MATSLRIDSAQAQRVLDEQRARSPAPAGPTVPDPRGPGQTVDLELTVRDPEIIAELALHADDPGQREEFALNALRIGVLALRQARGQVDQEVMRREGERLLEGLWVDSASMRPLFRTASASL